MWSSQTRVLSGVIILNKTIVKCGHIKHKNNQVWSSQTRALSDVVISNTSVVRCGHLKHECCLMWSSQTRVLSDVVIPKTSVVRCGHLKHECCQMWSSQTQVLSDVVIPNTSVVRWSPSPVLQHVTCLFITGSFELKCLDLVVHSIAQEAKLGYHVIIYNSIYQYDYQSVYIMYAHMIDTLPWLLSLHSNSDKSCSCRRHYLTITDKP
ncbi:hypothetical protein BgiBS90_030029 [Biomphalaria glabrata]|nr:hypothetical protein BgiBS90_030029 [Biomphalaria glabrata]